MSTSIRIGVAWLGLWLAVPAVAAAVENDLEALLGGVRKIQIIGSPGTVVPIGPTAFPLVVGEYGRAKKGEPAQVAPVVSAARLGKGRIVAFGHDGYLNPKNHFTSDTERLLINAIRWARGSQRSRAANVQVAVYNRPELLGVLQGQPHITAIAAGGKSWEKPLKYCHVFCIDTSFNDDPALADAVRDFVKGGGGLVTAGTGWGWAQIHKGKSLVDDYLGQRVLLPAGLVVTSQIAGATVEGGYAVTNPPPRLASASASLDLISSGRAATKDDLEQASHLLTIAIEALPSDETQFRPRLRKLTQQAGAVPMPSAPIRENQVMARLAIAMEDVDLLRQKPEQVRVHPAAAGFPGLVPKGAPRVSKTCDIDTRIPGWHSLGLYAAPGEVITVTVPASAADQHLGVRIGPHTDHLWRLATWSRWPNVSRQTELKQTQTLFASPFGGLIYLTVPDRLERNPVQVTVAGAVESPYYVLGQTSLAEWRNRIRNLPGPWAELQCERIIVTVQSAAVRKLDDPEKLMKFWNRAVELEDELAGWKPEDRKRPERFVTDQQISAGYMHSGYPIMAGPDMHDYNVSIASLTGTPAKPGGWGQWHELGHNHQSSDWTPSGTGEVTVNLFTMYVINQFYGVPLDHVRGDKWTHEQRRLAMAKYLASNRTPETWDPFEGLVLYHQLIDVFGWDALKKVLAAYRESGKESRLKTDSDKWDQWMIRYSTTVNKNLGPFFVKWKCPVTRSALDSIKSLPAWMHPDLR